MFVVHVIPLIRGSRVETLSYFSATEYGVGTILTVPIRGKLYQAMTTGCTAVTTAKSSLRSAGYTLRKLPPQKQVTVLPTALRETAERLTNEYPATTGAILYQLLPPDIRAGICPYPSHSDHRQTEDSTPRILTARTDERFLTYHSHIREMFAHRGSVLFVCPTTTTAEEAATRLRQGIAERVVLITSTQGKRERTRAYHACADTSIARLIITTPSFAYLDRVDLLSIIVEGCSSTHYTQRTRPYLDHRRALMHYAAVTGRQLILGDLMPPSVFEQSRRTDQFYTHEDEVKRIAFSAPLTVITQRDQSTPEQPFTLFSPKLRTTVARVLEGRGHVYFYGARRGLAPVVTCIDCGHLFRCPDSNTPYSLLRTYKDTTEERWFVSSTSGRRVRAADVCPTCGSWRLRERGIGIQHVYDEWRAALPEYPTILFDETTARTPNQAAERIQEFYSARAAVLIGTSAALPYLTKPISLSAVISFDATRTIPSWRADEMVFRLLLELREISEQEVIVQTRQPIDDLLTYATRGALERFYDDELLLRQQLHYPPFCRLILLTWIHTSVTRTFTHSVQQTYAAFTPQCYRNPGSSPERPTMHALMRIPVENTTTYATLLAQLRQLPPFVKVEINPDRVV